MRDPSKRSHHCLKTGVHRKIYMPLRLGVKLDAMSRKRIRIKHVPTGTLIAEGPVGWGITPFEGNYYISRRYLLTKSFRVNYLPGFCPYKFLYIWLDFVAKNGHRTKNLGWLYFLPNPLLPFIWFRVAVPGQHPDIQVELYAMEPNPIGQTDARRHRFQDESFKPRI